MTGPNVTVGLLYPGEMGCALASLLLAHGTPVVTTVHERSDRTARRCAEAGIAVLPSLADVVRRSDVVISLVPPSAAEEVADDYCAAAHLAPAGGVYVDANSIGPELATALAVRVYGARRTFVDGAVNGLARNLATGGTLFLSGTRAADVARLFEGKMRVQTLDNVPGRASAMKMLLAGLSKGVCALFVELALVARREDLLPEMLDAAGRIYPGITAVVERMLPTYAQHADRRATEMNELERTAIGAGLEPGVIRAVRELHEALADSGAVRSMPNGASVGSLIEHLAARGLLRAETAVTE